MRTQEWEAIFCYSQAILCHVLTGCRTLKLTKPMWIQIGLVLLVGISGLVFCAIHFSIEPAWALPTWRATSAILSTGWEIIHVLMKWSIVIVPPPITLRVPFLPPLDLPVFYAEVSIGLAVQLAVALVAWFTNGGWGWVALAWPRVMYLAFALYSAHRETQRLSWWIIITAGSSVCFSFLLFGLYLGGVFGMNQLPQTAMGFFIPVVIALLGLAGDKIITPDGGPKEIADNAARDADRGVDPDEVISLREMAAGKSFSSLAESRLTGRSAEEPTQVF